MPISKPLWGLALPMLLAGCLAPLPLRTPGEFSYSRAAPRSAVLVPDAVSVAGPKGYCVDSRAGRKGFVLLASCGSVTGKAQAPRPAVQMLLTSTATPEMQGDTPILQQVPQLERFFAAPEGLAALARNGDAASVRLISTGVYENAFVVHARHGSASQGMATDQWRALFNLNGQIVSASANALSESPVSGDAGLANLLDFVSQIRAVSKTAEVSGQS